MFGRLPPLHALAAFEAVARHRSFSRAAEELSLTDSAVSHRIRQLERAVEARLFLRLNRDVVLTPAGSAFLQTVRETLERLQSASAQVRGNHRPTLRVSPAPAIASNWLAHRIGDFLARHPDIDLEVQSSRQMIDLRRSEIDIGIRFGTGEWPSCHAVALFTEDTFPVCSPLYLEKHGPIGDPADLARVTLLRTPFMPWKPWFEAAAVNREEPASGPLFKEVLLLQDACVNGAGVALAGSVIAAPDLRAGRLVRLFDISVPAQHSYWVVCLQENLKRREVAAFIEWVTDEAREAAFKGAEESIRQSDERLRLLVEHLPQGAVLVEGGRIYFNKAVEAITGFSRAEVRTVEQWFHVLYGHRAHKVRVQFEQDRGSPHPVLRTTAIRRKDGTERLVETSTFAVPGAHAWLMTGK